jgi:hypothetical protein
MIYNLRHCEVRIVHSYKSKLVPHIPWRLEIISDYHRGRPSPRKMAPVFSQRTEANFVHGRIFKPGDT